MAEKEVILSKEKYEELKKELDYLQNVKRSEVAAKIKAAREFGDLSENAEYDEAKEEQGFVEGEIRAIQYKIRNAVIIDTNANKGVVSLGNSVKVFDEDFDEEVVYTIVGSEEVDLSENKISNESPIGAALLDKKPGDVALVQIPDGVAKLKVLEILE